jgi:hypothetical protein
MENKYFTPDIEDVCIGYEHETYSIGLQMINGRFLPDNERDDELKWRPRIIKCGSDILNLEASSYPNEDEPYKSFKTLWKDYIRVPYLTKEQIEAEGWTDDTASFQKPELFVAYQNSSTWRKLVYRFSDNMLQIVEVDDSYIYSGNCKDINTFRKITKLLKIN